MKKFLALAPFLLFAVAACGDDDDGDPGPSGSETPLATGTAQSEAFDPDAELTIYSGRREPLFQPIVELFEEETSIDVSVKYGSTTELGAALIEEQGNPQADLFVGTDAASAEELRDLGVFAPFDSPALEAIDARYRADDGSWVGVSGRARVIMYNTELVEEEELPVPESVLDLVDGEYEGEVAIPSTLNSSFTAWVSALRQFLGDDEAESYLEGLQDNDVLVLRDHTEVRQAVGRGEVAFGLVNHYYYQLEKEEGSPVGVIYPDQGDDQMGVLVNVAAASIVNEAGNREAAEMFMEFLLSEEAQEIFAATNFEYPLIEGVETRADVPLGEFKEFDVDLAELGRMNEETLDLLDRLGL
ncbi:MAG: extracellular solute-binding protein [Dehalococcoidia bacterium]